MHRIGSMYHLSSFCTSLILCAFFAVSSCVPSINPIDYGEDACIYCKMTIVDPQHAAQLVSTKGKNYYFDAIECMIQYLDDIDDTAWAHILVNSYELPKQMVDAEKAHFLICEAIPSPMGAYLSAFESHENAEEVRLRDGGEIFDWPSIQMRINNELSFQNE